LWRGRSQSVETTTDEATVIATVDTVQTLHADAWQAYRQGFPEVAAALFRRILHGYPNSREAADARYYLTNGYRFPADRSETQYAAASARHGMLNAG
jgi:TolA-binding protein